MHVAMYVHSYVCDCRQKPALRCTVRTKSNACYWPYTQEVSVYTVSPVTRFKWSVFLRGQFITLQNHDRDITPVEHANWDLST